MEQNEVNTSIGLPIFAIWLIGKVLLKTAVGRNLLPSTLSSNIGLVVELTSFLISSLILSNYTSTMSVLMVGYVSFNYPDLFTYQLFIPLSGLKPNSHCLLLHRNEISLNLRWPSFFVWPSLYAHDLAFIFLNCFNDTIMRIKMISWSLTSRVWYHLHWSAVFIQTLLCVLSFEPHIFRLSFLFASSEMYF